MNLEFPKKILKKPEKPDEPEFNRREGLKIFGTGVAVGTTGTLLVETAVERIVEHRENGFEQSEIFERQLSGYRILYGELKRNEILFIDQDGAPIGRPVQIGGDIDGVPAGNMDENGLVVGRLNQRWLDLARTRVCAENNVPCDLPNSLPRQINSITAIREAVNAGLNPDTFLDIVRHYARERAENGERKIDFVRRRVMEGVSLPDGMKRELVRLIPGLAAQESRYNDASVSEVGARGTFQFMPDTWRELGYSQADFAAFGKQVEGVGRYFVRMYQFITASATESLVAAKREYFGNDEAAFEKFFLTPILVNAYNAGPARLVVVVNRFLERYPNKQALEALIGGHSQGFGYDAYIAMARETSGHDDRRRKVPGYGEDSSEYVPRIYALADLLD